MVLFLLLCTGLMIGSWPQLASAAYNDPITHSYDLTVKVPGPPPAAPAVITAPVNDAIFTAVPITVHGTCPDKTYVEVFRNDVFSGVALCDQNGLFQLESDLFVGRNDLVAKVFSSTDVPGPVVNAVTVYYKPPQPPIPSSGGNTNAGGGTSSPSSGGTFAPQSPLLLIYDFTYRGIYAGQEGTWTVGVSGGTVPYALSVDWGDGKRDVVSVAKAGTVPLKHVYGRAGGYRGAYTVTITASDLLGHKTTMQLLAVVADPAGGLAAVPMSASSIPSHGPTLPQTVLTYVWPVYGSVVLVAVAFWLGEWNELRKLRPVRRHKLRHA